MLTKKTKGQCFRYLITQREENVEVKVRMGCVWGAVD
jgi:hypothetical protein